MKYSLDGQNETKLPQWFPLLPQHTVWGSVPMLPQILKSHLTMYTVFTFHVLMWPKWTIAQNNCARNCNTHMVSCPTQLRWFTPASYEQLLNFCSPSLQVPFNQTYYNISLPSQTSWTFALLPPTQTHTIYRSADFIIILSSHRYTALTFPPNGNTWPSLGQISTDRHHETISSVSPLHSVFLSFFPLTSWLHLSSLLIAPTRSHLSLLQHHIFIISSADFFSALALCQTTSCIYKSILSRWNIFNSSVLSLSFPSDLQQMFDQAVPHCIIQRRVWAAVIRHVCLTWCIGSV